MRIKLLKVKNFKSLSDFELILPKFTCLVGLNGAGKSTLLQFIDFIGQQVRGDMEGWLTERHWDAGELASHLSGKRNIEFEVSLVSESGDSAAHWNATYNPSLGHCTRESIKTQDAALDVKNGRIRIVGIDDSGKNSADEIISYSYQGSVLSQLKDEILPSSLLEFKNYFKTINSLDLLSPEYLRQRTRESKGFLGLGGQNLSAFLHEMSNEQRDLLVVKLRAVYPQVRMLGAKSLRSGWKQLEVHEAVGGSDEATRPHMLTEARHINDGMLRLIAILAALASHNRFLLFDEIENGINPELIEFVLTELVNAQKQIVVTTHSPMILNYLSDETAREGVVYLFKDKQGHTKSVPFFSIPSLAEKLTMMGPGEAFVDTHLPQLADEIESFAKER